jgi:hypothetical protein
MLCRQYRVFTASGGRSTMFPIAERQFIIEPSLLIFCGSMKMNREYLVQYLADSGLMAAEEASSLGDSLSNLWPSQFRHGRSGTRRELAEASAKSNLRTSRRFVPVQKEMAREPTASDFRARPLPRVESKRKCC